MRSDYGRKAAKEYRAAGLLPVNIYGLGKENLTVTIDRKEFSQIFMAGHRIFTLEVGEDKEQGVIKEVQYDALGSELLHVDFSRIDIHQKITLEVAIEVIGTVANGALDVPMKEIKVESLPTGFPSSITINVVEMKIGDVLRVSDLEAPEGCSFAEEPDALVAQVSAIEEEEAEVSAEEGEEGADADEPEVIGKPQDEDGDSAAGEGSGE
ncbi:MAG: 50S ribosomal protein L25 [Planctomycetota bacterium]|nr:50S ribosomal protein L25 [Planctomycetota bacterium]MEC9032970.1 50S ribosomal protein L25 [Planctomycetota bacterium]